MPYKYSDKVFPAFIVGRQTGHGCHSVTGRLEAEQIVTPPSPAGSMSFIRENLSILNKSDAGIAKNRIDLMALALE